MSDAPKVSVVVLTRDRPKEFRAMIQSLAYQRYPNFEVIVIGALASAEAHGAPPALARRLTYAQCEAQNISLSRNIGVSLAKGEIIAFTDDDATAEPDWLSRLAPAFEDPDIGGVGGYVRGRNGVDWQWRGALVDRYGGHKPLNQADLALVDPKAPDSEFFFSTVGVNGAFRASALRAIGGFDENYHYFLDESDVCVRLQRAGWRIALQSEAEVHHSYAESTERRANRAPRDLFQIAASRAYFALTYGHEDWVERRIAEFCDDQRERLTKFVQLGRLSRRLANEIEARMNIGVAEGAGRFDTGFASSLDDGWIAKHPAEAAFHRADLGRRPRVALIVAGLARGVVNRAARKLRDHGCEVTVIDFEYRAKRLRVWFEDGIWRHVGGVLGRDRFDAPLPTPRRYIRALRELERVGARRDFDVVIRPAAARYRLGDLRPTPLGWRMRGFVAEPLRAGGASEVASLLSGK